MALLASSMASPAAYGLNGEMIEKGMAVSSSLFPGSSETSRWWMRRKRKKNMLPWMNSGSWFGTVRKWKKDRRFDQKGVGMILYI